jgi:hypothetical protein
MRPPPTAKRKPVPPVWAAKDYHVTLVVDMPIGMTATLCGSGFDYQDGKLVYCPPAQRPTETDTSQGSGLTRPIHRNKS